MMICLWISALILCLWKCSYGFSDDEPFYYTIPLRILQGDALMVNEWHVSQLSSFFLIPYVFLFTRLSGCTDGIIVFARYIYVFLHFFVSLFLFRRLKKHGCAAFIASLSYFIFSPFEMMTYYYNTMTMDFLVLSFCLFGMDDFSASFSPFCTVLSGLCFAGAVVCCPYLSAVYFIFAVYVLLSFRRDNALFTLQSLAFFTLGIAILAVIFLSVVFSRTSISAALSSLSYIFNDPEHPMISLYDRCVSIFYSTVFCHPLFPVSVAAYAFLFVILCIDKKRSIHWAYYMCASAVIVIFTFCIFLSGLLLRYYGAIMVPFLFPGLTAYILCENKPRRIFCSFFVCGLIYALCLCFTSNLYFLVMPAAISVSNIASMIFIGELLAEKQSRLRSFRIAHSAVAVCVCALLVLQVYVKHEHSNLGAEPTRNMNYYIDIGPAKGTYTNREKYTDYMEIISDIAFLKAETGSVAYLSVHPWMYLYTDNLSCGAYSAWLSGEGPTALDRLESYWMLNPDKLPTYVYIPGCSYFDLADVSSRLSPLGYAFSKTASGTLALLNP